MDKRYTQEAIRQRVIDRLRRPSPMVVNPLIEKLKLASQKGRAPKV